MGGFFCQNLRPILDVSVAEAFVSKLRSGNPFVPISEYSPATLDTPFPRRYFKVKSLPGGEQWLTRAPSTAIQYRETHGLCVRLPITAYTPIRKSGLPGRRVTDTTEQDCVSMRIYGSKLQIDMSWNTTDDFDLIVREPSGKSVFRGSNLSPSGGRLRKDAVPSCNSKSRKGSPARETVTYSIDADVQSGRYFVRAKQFLSCQLTDTKVIVTVVIDGLVVAMRETVASSDPRRDKFDNTFVITEAMLGR